MTAHLFSDEEQDAIVELMNIGVGRAAAALSHLTHDEVLLSVPKIDFVTYAQASRIFDNILPETLAGVMQSFQGFIQGQTTLIFPEERSLELVKAIVGDELPDGDISELEQDTLAELGNILLNSCLATLANLLNSDINTSLPETYVGNYRKMLELLCKQEDSVIMLAQIDFTLSQRAIQGYLVFIIDMHSAASFKAALQQYFDNLT